MFLKRFKNVSKNISALLISKTFRRSSKPKPKPWTSAGVGAEAVLRHFEDSVTW
jgi:hypothetical protein